MNSGFHYHKCGHPPGFHRDAEDYREDHICAGCKNPDRVEPNVEAA